MPTMATCKHQTDALQHTYNTYLLYPLSHCNCRGRGGTLRKYVTYWCDITLKIMSISEALKNQYIRTFHYRNVICSQKLCIYVEK